MAHESELDEPAPDGCKPCFYCNSTAEMYSERSTDDGWHGGNSQMIRIGCLCDASDEAEDKYRTHFCYPEEALAVWNKFQDDNAELQAAWNQN